MLPAPTKIARSGDRERGRPFDRETAAPQDAKWNAVTRFFRA
jgi:hypothetical protein